MPVGPEGLTWQTVQWSFSGGLQTKTHPHAVEPPQLTVAKNTEFDELGAARLRHPYESLGLNIFGGGTIAGADLRKVVPLGDELLLFTKDAVYVWSAALSVWLRKDTHLAIAVSEQTRFDNVNDQVFADRAQLGGVVAYVWVETMPGGLVRCWLAVADATTGSTVLAPVDFGANRTRPRVVAVDTRILVLWLETGVGLVAKAIDPAAPAFTATGGTTVSSKEGPYDVVRDPAADRVVAVVRNSTGTAYDIARVTAGLAVTASAKARTSEGPMAVAVSPTGQYAQVVRAVYGGTFDILGDMIVVATLADNVFDQVIGTAATANVNHITAAYRTVQDAGEYRCYCFWSVDEGSTDGAPVFELKSNWFGTSLGSGTEATFLLRQGIAARAFDHGGRVYLWSVFAQQSYSNSGALVSIQAPYQNTYFLHRDDGRLVSKSTWQRAGGLGYYGEPTRVFGHLPGVALVSGSTGYAWCGVERQLVTTQAKIGRTYGARAPRDVLFTFDSDSARRVVQLGRTAYVTGGLVMQWDGEALTEVGFQAYPWVLDLLATGVAGGLTAGKYTYRSGYRWPNARGEVDRSTSATDVQVTLAGANHVKAEAGNLHVTLKQSPNRDIAVEFFRTRVNPVPSSPFYLISSRDPAVQTGANRYVENDPTQLGTGMGFDGDSFTDVELLSKEQHVENGAVVPRMAPPGATIIAASDSRLFLAGIPGEPTRVWYSLLRGEGEVAAFFPGLSFDLPASTGAVTALVLWQETLIVFTATAVYIVTGDGFSNSLVNPGGNYRVGAVPLAADVGAVSADAVAITPGGVVFASRKGWHRLNGGWQLEYIGAPVEAYNADTWVGAHVVEAQHHVRFLSTSRMLVWDYSDAFGPTGVWSEWTQTSGRGLAIWRGLPMLVDTAVRKQSTTFAAVNYSLEVELIVRWAGLLGFALCKRFQVLGQFKADHAQRVRVAFDHQAAFTDERYITFAGLTVGDPTRLQHGPSRKRSMALRVRITVCDTGGNVPAYDAVTLTGIAFELGFDNSGLYPRVSAAHK